MTKRRVENEDGVPLVMGYHLDVTQWRGVERSLQAALAREQGSSQRILQFAQRLLDALPMPVYVKDAQSRYLIVNATQIREWQRPAEELIGRTSMSLAPTEEIRQIMRDEDAPSSRAARSTRRRPTTTRRPAPAASASSPRSSCHDADGAPVIVCTMFDMTAWRNTERELQAALGRERELRKRTQTFVQRLIDVIPDPFYVKSAEGRFLIVNEAMRARSRPRRRADRHGFLPVRAR